MAEPIRNLGVVVEKREDRVNLFTGLAARLTAEILGGAYIPDAAPTRMELANNVEIARNNLLQAVEQLAQFDAPTKVQNGEVKCHCIAESV